jgi:hypothetical protein
VAENALDLVDELEMEVEVRRRKSMTVSGR